MNVNDLIQAMENAQQRIWNEPAYSIAPILIHPETYRTFMEYGTLFRRLSEKEQQAQLDEMNVEQLKSHNLAMGWYTFFSDSSIE